MSARRVTRAMSSSGDESSDGEAPIAAKRSKPTPLPTVAASPVAPPKKRKAAKAKKGPSCVVVVDDNDRPEDEKESAVVDFMGGTAAAAAVENKRAAAAATQLKHKKGKAGKALAAARPEYNSDTSDDECANEGSHDSDASVTEAEGSAGEGTQH